MQSCRSRPEHWMINPIQRTSHTCEEQHVSAELLMMRLQVLGVGGRGPEGNVCTSRDVYGTGWWPTPARKGADGARQAHQMYSLSCQRRRRPELSNEALGHPLGCMHPFRLKASQDRSAPRKNDGASNMPGAVCWPLEAVLGADALGTGQRRADLRVGPCEVYMHTCAQPTVLLHDCKVHSRCVSHAALCCKHRDLKRSRLA